MHDARPRCLDGHNAPPSGAQQRFVRAIGPLCWLSVCAILVAGLWPFCAPKNQVAWIQGENGIRFGEHGTALSSTTLPIGGGPGACTIEIWAKPAKLWTTGSILTFYNPQTGSEFSIKQDYADLLLVIRRGRGNSARNDEQLWVENVFRTQQRFITIASDGRETQVYVDGQLAITAPGFPLSSQHLAGQIILANAPLRDHSWSGELKGLAIYRVKLSSAEVQQQYQHWITGGAPTPDKIANAAAVYVFREHRGSLISSLVQTAPTLNIPGRFLVVDHSLFESPVSESRSDQHYLKDALINVAGFIPLGFVCGLYFGIVRKLKQSVLITVVIGATVSVAIEYFQSFLPTRFSGVTDIITNTGGTLIGAMLVGSVLRLASKYRAGLFARLGLEIV